jgi:hypothetical protein
MAFPDDLTNAIDGVTEIEAAHLNNLEKKAGINNSADTTSLDYQLRHADSHDPGHKHSAGSFIGGNDGDLFHRSAGVWSPKTPEAAGVVDKSTAQTVAGVKTFSSVPLLPAADPTQDNEAVRKIYVDTGLGTKVNKAGDTMSGNLAMGGNKVTGLAASSGAGEAVRHDEWVGEVDPGHKHSKVHNDGGSLEALSTDANGVLHVPVRTAPSASAADLAKVWVEDVNGEADMAGLHMMNEGLSEVKLIVPGVYIKTTTGDPASAFEGMIVINTVDEDLKMYAGGGWRELASWGAP